MLPNLNDSDLPTLVPFHCDGWIDLTSQTVVAPRVVCPDDPNLEPKIAAILQACKEFYVHKTPEQIIRENNLKPISWEEHRRELDEIWDSEEDREEFARIMEQIRRENRGVQ